mgnify:FL=1
MVHVDVILLVIVAELFLVLLIGVLVAAVLVVRRRRREHRATDALLARVKEQQQTTPPTLSGWLASTYGLAGAELEQAVARLQQEQVGLYRTILDALAERDETRVGAIADAVERLTASYRGLGPAAGAGGDPEALARLEQEKEAQIGRAHV